MSSIPAILNDPERLQAILKPKWKHTSDPKRSTAIQLSHNAHQFSLTKWRRERELQNAGRYIFNKSSTKKLASTRNLLSTSAISRNLQKAHQKHPETQGSSAIVKDRERSRAIQIAAKLQRSSAIVSDRERSNDRRKPQG